MAALTSEATDVSRRPVAAPPRRPLRDIFNDYNCAAAAANTAAANSSGGADDVVDAGRGAAYHSMSLDVVQGWLAGRHLDNAANRRLRPASAGAARRPVRPTLCLDDIDGARPRVLHPARGAATATAATRADGDKPSHEPAPPAAAAAAAADHASSAAAQHVARARPKSAGARHPLSTPQAPIYAMPAPTRLMNVAALNAARKAARNAPAEAAAARTFQALMSPSHDSTGVEQLLHNDFAATATADAGAATAFLSLPPSHADVLYRAGRRGHGVFSAAARAAASGAAAGDWLRPLPAPASADQLQQQQAANERRAFDKLAEALPGQRRAPSQRTVSPPHRMHLDCSDVAGASPRPLTHERRRLATALTAEDADSGEACAGSAARGFGCRSGTGGFARRSPPRRAAVPAAAAAVAAAAANSVAADSLQRCERDVAVELYFAAKLLQHRERPAARLRHADPTEMPGADTKALLAVAEPPPGRRVPRSAYDAAEAERRRRAEVDAVRSLPRYL